MKSSFLRTVAVVLTMCFGLSAGSANAGALTFNGWDFSTPGVASTAFSSSGLDASASYSDWLDFSLPASSDGSGSSANVVAVKTTGAGVIDLFELWESGSLVTSGGTGLMSSVLTWVGGAVPGSYQLKIGVSGANSYSGNIATPVPEPETYAMLLAGLGLIGFTARRRKNNA